MILHKVVIVRTTHVSQEREQKEKECKSLASSRSSVGTSVSQMQACGFVGRGFFLLYSSRVPCSLQLAVVRCISQGRHKGNKKEDAFREILLFCCMSHARVTRLSKGHCQAYQSMRIEASSFLSSQTAKGVGKWDDLFLVSSSH